MGKKSRITGGTVGRRTILQLSPPGSRGGNAGEREEAASGSDDEQDGDGHRFVRRTNMKAPAVKATEGLSLLGAYEDSDEEDAGDRATANSQHNQSADIDSTLANFMAEIDAITTQPSADDATSHPSVPNATPPRPDASAQQPAASEGQNQQSTEFEYNTQYSLAGVGVEMGDWQEVWDENSGCYYYWNTTTNEVSWELPHYLADQVQSLGHYSNSSSVNGNGTAHAGYYTEGTAATPAVAPTVAPTAAAAAPAAPAAAVAAPASAKETKAKEVIESVVGLTSEEEERRGVAASLLGPLIPSEVKEAEEKWRKRLLKGVDETENSLDSDGEGVRPVGSPSTPLRDSDSAPTVQKDQSTKKQSGDNSEADEETEEDTMELELALERKKAELRALEEGDVSAGGSSPCSETSQDASRGVLLKKNRWKTAFPCVPSPDSNSRGSDLPENTETPLPKVSESVEDGENKETDSSEDKTVSQPPAKEEGETPELKVETPELKFQIGELANTLTSKMEFLGINKKAISNFQLLLLQTETRIADWREGALNGVYLRRRLQEAAEHIKYYELNATPKGWSCHWDREHRRYFYVKDRTGASQWDFPTEDDKEEDLKGSQGTQTQTSSQGDPKPPPTSAGSSTYVAPPPPPQPSASSLWSPSQPPLPDSPPPPSSCPPPPPLPPDSPPPPPPPPDSDGEIMEVEMEMDDDNDEEPPAPGTEDDGSGRPPLPPGIASTKIVELSGPLGKGQKRKAGQLNKAITIGSSPILYTQAPASAAPLMSAAAYWGVPAVAAPLVPCEPPAPPVPALPPQPPLPPSQPPFEPPSAKALPIDKTKKAKKDKSKKSKTKMPSLVKKWQSIQKELDEEEKSSSSDEDREQINKKCIEEWKQQQLVTGKASKNANFEALPEDWRERLKKRKMMNST
ncbi:formin-binding protein 4 isoform X2 [Stegastes partitus]|uniref:Formin-binding protein 4 isoform X2 n=1 Tax=Stegastes partitus TaxID=144197 RepID=A0A9Y4K9X9_9TELE|nr:PREDICTED: formin-binding protein 4 isoform X2 [Stegastes partitus]